MEIIDVSPTRLNTDAGDIGHSVTGRMLSIACTPDGKELYVGSYANIWTSQDGGKRWTQLTWPQPNPTQYSVPGALGGWCVVDLAASLGWRVEKHPRILGRLTHSGYVDIVGFGECGMWIALGNGDGTFQQPNVVNAKFGLEADGWQVDKHPRFLADLNHDGLDDVVGFGFDGVSTAIGNGDGTFQSPRFVLENLGYNQGWRIDKHPRFALDINGDGNADVIGFGDAGVWVAIGDGLGGFAEARFVHANFGIEQGWRVDKHPRFVVDLDKDGRADIIGFGDAGVLLAFQNPDGSFREPASQPVLADFGVQQGWRVDKHPRFVVDLDDDGYPDIIGFGDEGTWTAINDRNGGFSAPRFTQDLFSFNTGWRVDKHPRIVIDLNDDGIADIIGFGDDGIWTAIGNGDGTFQPAQFVHANLGVNQGWRVDRHPRLAAVLGPGKVGIVGFGDAGVWSAVGDGNGGFPSSNLVLSNFGYGSIILALVANDLAMLSRGLWRSTDWGKNWTQVLQLSPASSFGELQWAQGSDHLIYAAGGSSLAISKNAGATFQEVFPWGNGTPARVNHVAVWQNEPADAFPSIIYALGDSTMFVSFDGGVTWTRDNGALPPKIGGTTSQDANGTSAHVMVISPRCPLQIYVAQNGSAGVAMLYRGDYTPFLGTQKSNWSPVILPDYLTLDPTKKNVQDSGNVFLVTTRRGCGDLLFYGPQRLSHIDDTSRAAAWVGPLEPAAPSDWHQLGSGHADLHGFLLSPDLHAQIKNGSYQPGAGTLWMLGDGGIYRSNNGGLNFTPADTAMTLSCLSVAGVAIAGKGVALSLNSGDNDGFYSMDGGQHWSYQQYGGGDNDCAFADPLRPHAMMVFTPRWNTAAQVEQKNATRHGQTVSVYQTQLGNLPDASVTGHDRKAVTGPPTVPDDQPSRDVWNAGSFYGARGSRPIVLGLANETAPDQGDYIFILNPNDTHPILVRTQNIFDIKHREEWITTAIGPGQGTNVFLQGPPLQEAMLGVVQAAGGHANPVYYVGGNGNLWKWMAGTPDWSKIVPALPPIPGKSVRAKMAVRFFVHPYLPNVIYILDQDHVKRSDDGGATWHVDQSLEKELTWNGQIEISDTALTDMKFDPNFFGARFAVGAGGAFMTVDGVTWTRLLHTAALAGRPSSCYYDWISDPSKPVLYVAFAGRSLVKITLNVWSQRDLTTVKNIVSIAGHFSTADQRHLVVVGTAQGKVHEIFWKPAQQGIEGEDDLPVAFGAGAIVSVASLYNSDQQRHVVLVGQRDGKVHEIFWKPETVGIEGDDDLPVTFSPGTIVAVSGLYNSDQQRHLVVVGTTAGKVHEIFWKADTIGVEGHDDLPVAFAPGSIVAVTAFYNTDQQRHVVVVGTSAGKLHEIFWKSDTVGIEGHDDLPITFASGSIVAVSGFYDSNKQRHVVIVGTTEGKVHQVYWKATTVGIEAHSTVTQFSAHSIVSLAGFYSASDQIEHIVVGLANGLLRELWVKPDI